jgi:hypothetical protein
MGVRMPYRYFPVTHEKIRRMYVNRSKVNKFDQRRHQAHQGAKEGMYIVSNT